MCVRLYRFKKKKEKKRRDLIFFVKIPCLPLERYYTLHLIWKEILIHQMLFKHGFLGWLFLEDAKVNRFLTDLVRTISRLKLQNWWVKKKKGRAGSQEAWKTMVQLMFDLGLHCLPDWVERRGKAREAGWQHKTTHTHTILNIGPNQRAIKGKQKNTKKQTNIFFFFF